MTAKCRGHVHPPLLGGSTTWDADSVLNSFLPRPTTRHWAHGQGLTSDEQAMQAVTVAPCGITTLPSPRHDAALSISMHARLRLHQGTSKAANNSTELPIGARPRRMRTVPGGQDVSNARMANQVSSFLACRRESGSSCERCYMSVSVLQHDEMGTGHTIERSVLESIHYLATTASNKWGLIARLSCVCRWPNKNSNPWTMERHLPTEESIALVDMEPACPGPLIPAFS